MKPALATRSVGALIEDARSALAIDSSDRDAMLDAMRVAAEKRIEGILGELRRRHYGQHAAALAASFFAAAPKDRQRAASGWIAQLLVAHSRRHAFKEAIEAALKSVGLAVPPRPA